MNFLVVFILFLCDLSFAKFLKSSTPVQAKLNSDVFYGFSEDLKDFGDDVDIISLHDDYYGIPWDYFLGESTEITSSWLSYINKTQLLIRTQWKSKPIFLSLAMVTGGGGRSCPSKNATTSKKTGKLIIEESFGCEKCFNFSGQTKLIDAYIRYVIFMIESFHPIYLNYAIEVNLFRSECGLEKFRYVIDFCNLVYSSVKEKYENEITIFPSLQIDDFLIGEPCLKNDSYSSCVKKHLSELSTLKRDRFAISTYPHVAKIGYSIDFTMDWIPRILDQIDEPSVIAETGFLDTSMTIDISKKNRNNKKCQNIFISNLTMSSFYLEYMMNMAMKYNMDILTWFSNQDLIPSELETLCPCVSLKYLEWCIVEKEFKKFYSPAWEGELVFKLFGSMGIRDYKGTEKEQIFKIWNQ